MHLACGVRPEAKLRFLARLAIGPLTRNPVSLVTHLMLSIFLGAAHGVFPGLEFGLSARSAFSCQAELQFLGFTLETLLLLVAMPILFIAPGLFCGILARALLRLLLCSGFGLQSQAFFGFTPLFFRKLTTHFFFRRGARKHFRRFARLIFDFPLGARFGQLALQSFSVCVGCGLCLARHITIGTRELIHPGLGLGL